MTAKDTTLTRTSSSPTLALHVFGVAILSFTLGLWFSSIDVDIMEHVSSSQSTAARVLRDLYNQLDGAVPKSSANSAIGKLSDWIQGGFFDNIELVQYGLDEHRGLHAKNYINTGDVVMSIPEDFIVTSKLAWESELGKRIHAALPEAYPDRMSAAHNFIALWLTEQRGLGTASAWHPYLATLPENYSNVPANFGEEDMELLRQSGNQLEQATIWAKESIRDDYKAICMALPDFCMTHSFDDYNWARVTLQSRAFSLHVDGVDETAMMPYLDMINHDFDNLASWRFNPETRRGEIYAQKPIAEGVPLSLTYGHKSNRRLLSLYGFAMENNPHDTAVVHVALPDGEIANGMLARRVAKSGNPDSEFYKLRHTITAQSSDSEFQRALALARISVATEEELQHMVQGGVTPVTLRNEAAALHYISRAVDVSLSKSPQSIEVDNALLGVSTLPNNYRNIILTRKGEKLVLINTQRMIDDLLMLADPALSFEEFNRRRVHPRFHSHFAYVSTLTDLRRQINALELFPTVE